MNVTNPFFQMIEMENIIKYSLVGIFVIISYFILKFVAKWLISLNAYTLLSFIMTSVFCFVFVSYLYKFTSILIEKTIYIYLLKTLSVFSFILLLKKIGGQIKLIWQQSE